MSEQTQTPELIHLDLSPDEAALLVDYFDAACLAQLPLNYEARGGAKATDEEVAEPMRALNKAKRNGMGVAEYLESDLNRTGHTLSRKLARVMERLRELGLPNSYVRGARDGTMPKVR